MEVNRQELMERVKAYNNKLKQAQSEAATLSAHISYSETDVMNSCKELSELLGMEVTPDTLQSIRESEYNKIINNLEMGEEILKRIEDGEEYDNKQVVASLPGSFVPNQDVKESIVNEGLISSVESREAEVRNQIHQTFQEPTVEKPRENEGINLNTGFSLYEI